MNNPSCQYRNVSLPEKCTGDYRFGFNGMEGDDEVRGAGNSYTTEFRQYDPRIGRWLSIDPIQVAYESPYAAFRNNPIILTDPNGDFPSDGDPGKKLERKINKFGKKVDKELAKHPERSVDAVVEDVASRSKFSQIYPTLRHPNKSSPEKFTTYNLPAEYIVNRIDIKRTLSNEPRITTLEEIFGSFDSNSYSSNFNVTGTSEDEEATLQFKNISKVAGTVSVLGQFGSDPNLRSIGTFNLQPGVTVDIRISNDITAIQVEESVSRLQDITKFTLQIHSQPLPPNPGRFKHQFHTYYKPTRKEIKDEFNIDD
jgi:RHS repeat-associated protein